MTAAKSEPQLLTVSEVTRKVKLLIEGGFPSIAVQGELSNVKLHSSGHIYFTLKDDASQISGVLWRSRTASLGFVPEDGLKVIVTGRLTVYEVRGVYQIDAFSIRQLGIGELQIAFERLKKALAAEGLFDAERKKPLPEYPERLGIITSPTGAVLHDILNILTRRFPGIEVIFRPAKVQGSGAAQDIAAALNDVNEFGSLDLVIIARGGGSLEDLWAFNEEIVARAIAASRIPVVSAVGHEVDYTIADFVADLRAPTPSAAAELVVRDRRDLLELLKEYGGSMNVSVNRMLDDRRDQIRHLLESYSFNRPIDLLRQYSQRVDELQKALGMATGHTFQLTQAGYKGLQQRMQALNPRLVLKRGYTIIRKDSVIVSSRRSLRSAEAIEIEFHDGRIDSRVE